MPSRIYFVGSAGDSPLSLDVAEDVEELAKTLKGRNPWAYTQNDDGRRVYVNPSNVAYWIESPERGIRAPRLT